MTGASSSRRKTKNQGKHRIPKSKVFKVTRPESIKPGTAIAFSNGLVRQHALVLGPDKVTVQNGYIEVELMYFRYIRLPSRLKLIPVKKRLKIDKIRRIEYESGEPQPSAVARALSRKYEQGHHIQWNNSRDFVRWCCIEHSSNREQCRVPINDLRQLMADNGSRTENEVVENLFTGCHIELLRLVPLTNIRLYSHHAYLHELKILQDGLAEGAMYEKGTLHPKVCEKTVDLSNATIKLVKYSGFEKLTRELGETRLKQVESRTFLYTRDRSKAGSKVRDSDFCFWFMTGADLEYLFGRRLKQLQKNVNELAKLKVFYEHSDTFARIESATLEKLRDGGSQPLEPFSHLIVETKETRCGFSEKTQVCHYVFKNWSENSRDKMEAVTYAVTKDASCLQTEVQEVKSIVRVTGSNQVVKVVDDQHPESRTVKTNFEALTNEDKEYNLICNNCEHLVNQLKYGEKSSEQVECCLPGSKMRIFGGLMWTAIRVSYFATSFSFASYWPEVGFGIFVILVLIGQLIYLRCSRRWKSVSSDERLQRVANIVLPSSFALAAIVLGVILTELTVVKDMVWWRRLLIVAGIGLFFLLLGSTLTRIPSLCRSSLCYVCCENQAKESDERSQNYATADVETGA